MEGREKDFINFLRKHGYALPESEEHIKKFEENNKTSSVEPKEWDSVDDILQENKSKIIDFSSKIENSEIKRSLSMAAREGKEISKEIRDKMKSDRDNAKKK